MFKDFFIHYNRPVAHSDSSKLRHSPRGFTAKISPDPINERNAFVQVTFCSPRDEFIKKEGRSQAVDQEAVSFNKREIPGVLAKCANTCEYHDMQEHDYMYVLKYVV